MHLGIAFKLLDKHKVMAMLEPAAALDLRAMLIRIVLQTDMAGWLLRTSTRPMVHRRTESARFV